MRAIKLYWWRNRDGTINYGDDISPFIVERISGRPVEHTSLERCDLIATGSLLDRAAMRRWKRLARLNFRPLFVWGSGSLQPLPPAPRNLVVEAVRGPRTRDAMGLPRTLPIGDPALLLSAFINRPQKRYRWGIIPHVSDRNHPMVAELQYQPGARVIDLTDPDTVGTAALIASCHFVASSSLHGLITADSFGVPNVWLKLSDALDGGDWKFVDYFESVRRATSPLKTFASLKHMESLAVAADSRAIESRVSDLTAAFARISI